MKIKDIMTDPAIMVSKETTIEETARLMQEHNIGALPVVDDNETLVGIVTDRDIIVRNIAMGLDPKTHTAQEVMTKNVITITPETDASYAAKLMTGDRIRRIPVMENDKLVGMVALGDIATCDHFNFEAAEALSEISAGCHIK